MFFLNQHITLYITYNLLIYKEHTVPYLNQLPYASVSNLYKKPHTLILIFYIKSSPGVTIKAYYLLTTILEKFDKANVTITAVFL